MRNSNLHAALQAFAAEAAEALWAETDAGAEIPFEVTETGARRRAALYCYRPLTHVFIHQRLGLLASLATYAPAARELESVPGLERHLEERLRGPLPAEPRQQADAALRCLLDDLFAERSEFRFEAERFERLYAELERALYDGRGVTTLLAPVLGLVMDAEELALEEGLALRSGAAMLEAPPEALWGTGELQRTAEPNVLAVLTLSHAPGEPPPLGAARLRLRRLLSALRLFEPGGCTLGPLGYVRAEGGSWRTIALGGGRLAAAGEPLRLSEAQEDELRAFCELLARRVPRTAEGAGPLAWAIARYEMGCERQRPAERLTDHLLALRALLEPEGPQSGRLGQRLAVLCALPGERAELAERSARAAALERAVISGSAGRGAEVADLADELGEHLRALLRDVVCGHLEADLPVVADGLLAQAVAGAAADG